LVSVLSPELLLRAYAAGIFPMAEHADDRNLAWFDPPLRGILPLDPFQVPKRLRRTVRQGRFEVRADTEFRTVMEACRESTDERPTSWINDTIVDSYCRLNELGFAHSVECWEDGELVGGLYGVALGGAFFGESMFQRRTDASKVALVHLAARLVTGGYSLLDTQFVTPHLLQFGAIEIPRETYRALLDGALEREAVFPAELPASALEAFLQSTTQTS
jgi:leucyl/phenylalanyl-tRNA--protein transferase